MEGSDQLSNADERELPSRQLQTAACALGARAKEYSRYVRLLNDAWRIMDQTLPRCRGGDPLDDLVAIQISEACLSTLGGFGLVLQGFSDLSMNLLRTVMDIGARLQYLAELEGKERKAALGAWWEYFYEKEKQWRYTNDTEDALANKQKDDMIAIEQMQQKVQTFLLDEGVSTESVRYHKDIIPSFTKIDKELRKKDRPGFGCNTLLYGLASRCVHGSGTRMARRITMTPDGPSIRAGVNPYESNSETVNNLQLVLVALLPCLRAAVSLINSSCMNKVDKLADEIWHLIKRDAVDSGSEKHG